MNLFENLAGAANKKSKENIALKKRDKSTEKRRDKSAEKKTEKSVINPELEEIIRHNLEKFMEEKRRKEEQKELEKRMMEERRMALEEGNRRIREANLKRFSLPPNKSSMQHSKLAWGVDQRKVYIFANIPLRFQFTRPEIRHEESQSPKKEFKP